MDVVFSSLIDSGRPGTVESLSKLKCFSTKLYHEWKYQFLIVFLNFL